VQSSQTPLVPRRLELAPGRQVEMLAIDPTNRWLAAAAGEPATVRVWDLQAHDPAQARFDLAPHKGYVQAAAFTADGQRLLTGCGDGVARLWNLGAAKPEIAALEFHKQDDALTAVAIAADGRRAAAGSKDGTLSLWSLTAEGKPGEPLRLHQFGGEVRSLAFSDDGRWLAAGAAAEPPRLWDLKAGKTAENVCVLPHNDESIDVVAFSPGGHWLATGGSREVPAIVWDLSSPDPAGSGVRLFRQWLPGELVVSQAVFLPRGAWLMTFGLDDVRLWPLGADELVGLARSAAGRSLAAGELQPSTAPPRPSRSSGKAPPHGKRS
jgi:WD40 repeat protein